MLHNITYTSTYARQILSDSKTGTIHSVYRKTVNITLGNFLLALQTADSPISAISLITNLSASDMECLNLKPGMPVRIADCQIQIGIPADVIFSYSNVFGYNLKLNNTPPNFSINFLNEALKQALLDFPPIGFQPLFNNSDSMPDSIVLDIAEKYLADCTMLFQNKDYKKAAEKLSLLIGLGIGLTPSGDDFLCGTLAGFLLSGQSDSPFITFLHQEIQSHLKDTNDISGAFLSCALENQFSLPVVSLLKPDKHSIFDNFSKIGHSSGSDTLCGILYAIQLSLS